MVQVLGLKEIEARKRALAAESEIYRQTLMLEVQNIRLYSLRVQRKFAMAKLANPLLLVVGSFIATRVAGFRPRVRRRGKWSVLGLALMAWRIFRSYGPLFQSVLFQKILAHRGQGESAPHRVGR